ncbi:sensor histidine kinase [Novosphingobium sp. BL-8H]|uniref:sensor histidine kinase n=1 Tax=Novosphingobium sp. BL-8H TaxID=3127640 RepID=UPI003756BFE1
MDQTKDASEEIAPADGIITERPAVEGLSPSSIMRRKVDEYDWSRTPLGPRAEWPSELEILVGQILDSSFPKAIVWGPDLTTIYNDAFLPILGNKPEPLGQSFAAIWAEAWDTIGPIAERAYAGIPTYIEDFPLLINRSGQSEQAWFTFCYSPLRLADGSIAGMLDTVVETTGKMEAQANLALVNAELGHRLKNTLSLVQAIVSQTLRGAADPSAMESLSRRLQALGHAHDVLLRRDWAAASLTEVIQASLEPHNHDHRISARGPELPIGSQTAISLSLILHELATNAAKYGALSRFSGRVSLCWSIEDENLTLCWLEAGGPPVSEPDRKGFGTRLVDMGLGSRSTLMRSYETNGFKLEMRTPLTELLS